MALTSDEMVRLANTSAFRSRLAVLAAQEAMGVRGESAATENHVKRDALAQYVLADAWGYAEKVAAILVGRTNLVAAGLVVAEDGGVSSAATDAEIRSQLATDWNVLAGV